MADQERPDTPAAETFASPVTSAAAVAAALGAAARSPELDAEAAGFLRDQRTLTGKQSQMLDLQMEHLHEERELHHRHLTLRYFGDRLRIWLQVIGIVISVLILGGLGTLVWSAANDRGLVIASFSVPPDLAARGLTGQVVASQIEDRLAFIQSHADTIRAASTFRNDWGDDIKVEIPDTGISIGELYRYLASALGHETRISGEVFRSASGLTIAARAGADAAGVFTGADADFDKLVNQAAEHIYRQTQPYRYAVFLDGQSRKDEEWTILRDLALEGPAEDKPWAYSRLGIHLQEDGDLKGAIEKERMAGALAPTLPHIILNLSAMEAAFGHDEASLQGTRRGLVLLKGPAARKLASYAVAIDIPADEMIVDEFTGDYRGAIALGPEVLALPDYANTHKSIPMMVSADLASAHDVAGSAQADRETPNAETRALQMGSAAAAFQLPPLPAMLRAVALDGWQAVRDDLVAGDASPEGTRLGTKPLLPVLTWPWLALAEAKLGDFAAAHAQIDQTPTDCYLCVRMRARIFAEEKNWPQADHWFGEAVRQAPSLPFAYLEWGEALLAKGDADGAIAKLTIAAQKGPHFADPLEVWAEALLAKGDYAGAVQKFDAANAYTPKWGRLHLRWGEALTKLGKAADAQKQFAVAATLDLSNADNAELAARGMPHA